MKIAIDISQVVYEGTGVARFTEGLIHAILSYDTKNEWVFFFSSLRKSLPTHLKQSILSKKHILITRPVPPKLLSLLWNQIHKIPVETFVGPVDWYISSDWAEGPAHAKKATIIHDLAYLRYPETVVDSIRKTQQKRLEWVCKESDIVFTDSHATKKDVTQLLHMPSEKVIVNYPGLNPISPSFASTQTLIQKPFILSVGKIEPRKNLRRLIEAYSALNQKAIDLVIVGPSGWDTLPKKEGVTLLGYVNDQTLQSLYQSCLFFVYPSLWEGFGYPVLEAMQQGAPVAVSDVASLSEIAKDSAILFHPEKVDSIQHAMEQLIQNTSLRKAIAAKGKKCAAEYTWHRYFDIFIKTLASKG